MCFQVLPQVGGCTNSSRKEMKGSRGSYEASVRFTRLGGLKRSISRSLPGQVGLDLLDYFFVKLMPVFSLMPMLEPPFSATRYASFFLFTLVLLLVFVTSFLAAYACFRRLCSSPRFLPLGMPVFLVYVRTYAHFCDLIFGCLCLFSSIMLAIWRDFDISSLLYLYCFRFARSKARTGSSTRVWFSWLVIPDVWCLTTVSNAAVNTTRYS